MGRGRAKAKQTKVARDLKYRSYSTDFVSLERELRGDTYEPVSAESAESADEVEADETDDKYADLADRYAGYGEDDEVRRIS